MVLATREVYTSCTDVFAEIINGHFFLAFKSEVGQFKFYFEATLINNFLKPVAKCRMYTLGATYYNISQLIRRTTSARIDK